MEDKWEIILNRKVYEYKTFDQFKEQIIRCIKESEFYLITYMDVDFKRHVAHFEQEKLSKGE